MGRNRCSRLTGIRNNVELRETITATTNKVEQYNQLCDWASFGAIELVASNNEDEMEKAVK